jgi:molybdate transport system substrate-binding protein
MRHGLIAFVALATCVAGGAIAADLKVLSAAAVQGPATEIAEQFARDTGTRVTFEFATAGQVDDKLAAGSRPDIVINGRGRIAAKADASAKGALVRDLGTVRVGVAARVGAQRPDLSSTAAFRVSLLRAQTIAYTDPARGGTVGIQFAKVIDDLGLRSELAGKIVLAANGVDVARKVARGEVELGITQVSEIRHIDTSLLVGTLPDALQLATTYTVWIPDPANKVAALTNDSGRARFRAAGFD